MGDTQNNHNDPIDNYNVGDYHNEYAGVGCSNTGTARQHGDNPNNGYVSDSYYNHSRHSDVSIHSNIAFGSRRARSYSVPNQMFTCIHENDVERSYLNETKEDFHSDYADETPRAQPQTQPIETRYPTHVNWMQ